MPRPVRHRRMQRPPLIKGFKPYGGQLRSKEKVVLLMEEYEAIRLMDFEMLTQLEGAKLMDVSRPTFTRIYDSARKKIGKALVLSMQLEIDGGNVQLEGNWFVCDKCKAVFDLKEGEKVDDMFCPHCQSPNFESINDQLKDYKRPKYNYHRQERSDTETFCVCDKCGLTISHKRGVPCRKIDCPKCKIPLYRE